MQDKEEFRKHFSSVRKAAKSAKKDHIICSRLLADEKIRTARTVLLYASFGSEIDTWELAERLLEIGKVIAFPRCYLSGIMEFHCVSDIKALKNEKPGKYGISEPDRSLPAPEISDDTVCIIPGLAFTEKGGRLGYGGGYYDRFLSVYPFIPRIAVAYEDMITDSLPLHEHDKTVNIIVTEERTVLCNE